MSPYRPKRNSTMMWYDNLFFNRRRPHSRPLQIDWIRPDDIDSYQRLIHDHGFVSPKYWVEGDSSKYPVIIEDAEDLAEYLLPTYFQFSQSSIYYQDRFYFYQWLIVQGIFLT